MEGMTHPMEGPMVEGGNGSFDAACPFTMSGEWTLQLRLEGPAGGDTLSVALRVE
jgi:hypothetical protein